MRKINILKDIMVLLLAGSWAVTFGFVLHGHPIAEPNRLVAYTELGLACVMTTVALVLLFLDITERR